MLFGAYMFPTQYAIGPVELGRALEERGFESVFFPEHTHIPASRRTPWPGGGELPEEYMHTFDPLVALGAVAAATERLRLGTGVALVVQRDPIITAKEVATLDRLSGGRVLFGVGGGWNREEMEGHGTDPARRWTLMRERVEAMKAIWSNDVAEYHGELVDFGPMWQWPKPVQRPHPPVLVGGTSPGALRRAVDYGDGWLPIPERGTLGHLIAELERLAAERGRGRIPITVFGAKPEEAAVEAFAAAGVDRCLFWVPPGPADEVLPRLDRYANLVARFPGSSR